MQHKRHLEGADLAARPRKVPRGQGDAFSASAHAASLSPWPDVSVAIKDAEEWRESYTRTRHKNLRCFPACLDQHSEHSFCGRPVYALVSVPRQELKDELGLAVFAEMRHSEQPHKAALGEPIAQARTSLRVAAVGLETPSQDGLLAGEFESWDEGSKRWLVRFEPPGRWRYHFQLAKHRSKETHVVSVILTGVCGATGGRTCLARVDSKPFRIASAWRRLDGPHPKLENEQPAAGSDSDGEHVERAPATSATSGDRVCDDGTACERQNGGGGCNRFTCTRQPHVSTCSSGGGGGSVSSGAIAGIGSHIDTSDALMLSNVYCATLQHKAVLVAEGGATPRVVRELSGAQAADLDCELLALHVYAGLRSPLNVSRLPRTLWPPPPSLPERSEGTRTTRLEPQFGQERSVVLGATRQLDFDLLSVLSNNRNPGL
jgi:hypothetical protein